MSSWYSDFPAARARQITADVIAAIIIVVAVVLGVLIGSAIAALGDVGQNVERAGEGFESTLSDLGDSLGAVPLIGEGIRVPLDNASGAGTALADAGRSLQDLVRVVAIGTGLLVTLAPIVPLVFVWLLPRLLFRRRSRQARALYASADGPELLALRALSTRTLTELTSVSPTPLAAWRAGEPGAVAGLAALELRRAGVRV